MFFIHLFDPCKMHAVYLVRPLYTTTNAEFILENKGARCATSIKVLLLSRDEKEKKLKCSYENMVNHVT